MPQPLYAVLAGRCFPAMKITIQEDPQAGPELVIRCPDASDPRIQLLLSLAAGQKLPVRLDGELAFFPPAEVLYCEYVERSVFAYTAGAVGSTSCSLGQVEREFPGFLRCSKNMVVNLYAIRSLRSELGGRLVATLCNGERILISRHYASGLRQTLSARKENSHEGI